MPRRLPEFLLARIAEDEAVADRADGEHWIMSDGDATVDLLNRVTPGRVLAECAAKRRIVERHQIKVIPAYSDRHGLVWCKCLYNHWPCVDLKSLATVYRGHPDYDPAWDADR